MKATKQHLAKAHELVKEEARVARHEWEAALEASRVTQRSEAKAREKYQALTATVQLLSEYADTDDGDVGPGAGTVHARDAI